MNFLDKHRIPTRRNLGVIVQNAPMLSLRNIAVALLVALAITTVIDLPTSAQDWSAAVATNINVVGGDQQIIVTWDPPNDPENRQVLVYLVQWREKSNTSNSGSKTINGDAPRTYTITDLNGVDLVNGTEYEVSIYSILAGAQEASAWITVVPNPGPLTAPGAPKNVTATPGINSLDVAWEAPTITANNAATRYFVQWKTGTQSYQRVDRRTRVSRPATRFQTFWLIGGTGFESEPRTMRAARGLET